MIFPADPTIDSILRGALLASAALVYVVLLVRLVGLRSFSKMTSFDFVMTVAMGSLLAGSAQANDWNAVWQAFAAMTGLFIVQYLISRARKSSDAIESAIQNEPILLMRDGQFIPDALDRTRVARSDLIAKLREANVMSLSEVRAVVLETTGDVSVLHGKTLDDELLQGVRNPTE